MLQKRVLVIEVQSSGMAYLMEQKLSYQLLTLILI